MKTIDIMTDPAYLPVLYAVESRILVADRKAQEEGIHLTDSQIRSVLHRVRKSSKQETKHAATISRRDQILEDLQKQLTDLGPEIMAEDFEGHAQALPTEEWHLCLQCVEESVRRHSTGSGSREYLEFIEQTVLLPPGE